MTKATVDTLIANMKKAGIVTKAAAWMMEGIGDKEMHVRYVGIKPYEDWRDIFSEQNNLLLKFLIDRTSGTAEFYLANKPPFVKIITRQLSDTEKWETLLGEVRRRLHKDKEDVQQHREQVGNIYSRILSHII